MKQTTTTTTTITREIVQRPPHRNFWIRPLYLLLVGLAILISGIVLSSMNNRLKDWVVVDGTVGSVTSSIYQRGSGSDSERRYSYGVTYQVDGKEYRATAVSASRASEGDTKQIAYNPANPNESVIGPTPPWLSLVFVVGGSAMLLASALYFFFGRRQLMAEKAALKQ